VRLGLLGGSFDPPHLGHWLAAVDALESLELDRLYFVPAGVQPFKQGRVMASGEQRLEMLARMVGGDERFAVDPVELERPGLSYTADTLAGYAERYPDAELYFLIGEDLAGQIGSWRSPGRIAELASIVVLTRERDDEPVDAPAPLPMRKLRTRRVDISSSEIRERIRCGRSIRGFVAETVAEYIDSSALYR
jgi:nicotinate-nucleotide adenylyltransferase